MLRMNVYECCLTEKELKAMKKKEKSPEYERAKLLYESLKDIQNEVQNIDRAIAEMQISKARFEMDGGKATPFFCRFFKIVKKKHNDKPDEFFAQPSEYMAGQCISLSEAELLMLKGFKQGRIDELNDEVRKLSTKINEDK